MLFEDKVTVNQDAFLSKVQNVADTLGVSADSLMTVMNSESGLDSTAVNPASGATGLIQFMPNTAAGLGTSTAALRAMSNVDQLDYVQQYYANISQPLTSYYDLYAATFYPYMIGQPDSYVIGSEKGTAYAQTIARQNPAVDINGNGVITLGDFKQWIDSRLPSFALQALSTIEANPVTSGLLIAVAIAIVITGLYFLFKKK